MARSTLLALGGFAGLALAAAVLAPSARAELRALAPPNGAVVAVSPVILIGSGALAGIDVTVNGKPFGGAKQSGKAFLATIDLVPGENVVLVRSGEESVRLAFTYTAKNPPATAFRYHPPVAEGDCKACHPQGVGRTFPVSEARLCSSCHDPITGGKYLHGPLGTGQCSICHDPHGSGNPKYLVMNSRALCVQCHAQSRSQSHIEKSGDKNCPECHDPHSSAKQYLLH
jgi:predicted CXXCH cytochrome family protein